MDISCPLRDKILNVHKFKLLRLTGEDSTRIIVCKERIKRSETGCDVKYNRCCHMFSLFYVHQVYQVAPGQRETDVLIETSSSYCRSYSKSLNQVAENI